MARTPRRDGTRVPGWIEPMLAKPDGGRLREGPDWTYEYKLDGYRACMQIAPDGTTRLTSRNSIDFTPEFAELTGVLAPALDGRAAVLDGEIVVYNEAGQPEFGMLQERRGRYQTHSSIRRAEAFHDLPVRFLAFDLLQLGAESLLGAPHDERRQQLLALPMPDPYRVAVVRGSPIPSWTPTAAPPLICSPTSPQPATRAWSRRTATRPTPRASADAWLKHPLTQTIEVVVCGWRPGQRRFTGKMGGLLLGAHDPDTGDLTYIGDVGTGFTEAERDRLRVRLETLERPTHPFAQTPPGEDVARARWVDPVLVGGVVYRQFTRSGGRLRHTSWRGLREDRAPAEVLLPQAQPRPTTKHRPAEITPDPVAPTARSSPTAAPPGPSGSKVTVQAGGRQLTLSNLDKPLYPTGFTKGEVIIHRISHRGARSQLSGYASRPAIHCEPRPGTLVSLIKRERTISGRRVCSVSRPPPPADIEPWLNSRANTDALFRRDLRLYVVGQNRKRNTGTWPESSVSPTNDQHSSIRPTEFGPPPSSDPP